MQISIKTGEIKYITKKFDDNTMELYKEIGRCIKDFEKMSKAFKGIGSEYIVARSKAYLEHLKTVPIEYYQMCTIIKKAHNLYREQDDEFARKLKEESCERNDDSTKNKR